MAAINLRATSHIKAKKFTLKKKEEERRNEEGERPRGEKMVIGIQPIHKRGGPL